MQFPAKIKYSVFIALSIAMVGGIFFILPHKTVAVLKPALLHKEFASQEEPLMTGFSFTEYDQGCRKFEVNAGKFFLRNKKVKPFGFRVMRNIETEHSGTQNRTLTKEHLT